MRVTRGIVHLECPEMFEYYPSTEEVQGGTTRHGVPEAYLAEAKTELPGGLGRRKQRQASAGAQIS